MGNLLFINGLKYHTSPLHTSEMKNKTMQSVLYFIGKFLD